MLLGQELDEISYPAGDGGNGSVWAGALAATAVIAGDDVTGIGVADDVLIPAVWAGAAAYVGYKYLNKQGVQYTLRTANGDIWKIGQTTQYDFNTGKQWRYPQSQLDAWGVTFLPEFPGNRLEILAVEKMKIWNYIHTYNALPPGNKVPW